MTRTASTAEAAGILGLAPSTLQKYAQAGRVPFDTTPGGHRRFDPEEVHAALEGPPIPPSLTQLRRRRRAILAIAQRHRLSDLRVVGSVARGEATAGSDVDLIATKRENCSFVDVVDAHDELEALLGVPVHIITTGSLRGRLADLAHDAAAL